MSDRFPRAQTAIVGAATFGVGKAPGFEASDLAAKASVAALAQAGLRPSDVDGLFFCHSTDTLGGLSFAQYLGIQPKFVDNNRLGGSSFQAYVELAAWLLAAGAIDVALVAYGSNQASAAGKLVNTVRPMPRWQTQESSHDHGTVVVLGGWGTSKFHQSERPQVQTQ